MAELASAAFAASTAAAGAGTAAAATSTAAWLAGTTVTTAAGVTTSLAPAAAAAGAAGAGSGLWSTLQGASTIASAATSLYSGLSGYQQAQTQAAFADVNADAARLESEERALRIRQELAKSIGATRVAFGASGVTISSGGAIEGALRSDAAFETGLARTSGDIKAAGATASAVNLRTRGTTNLLTAAAKAGQQLTGYKLSLDRRGRHGG